MPKSNIATIKLGKTAVRATYKTLVNARPVYTENDDPALRELRDALKKTKAS